MKAKLKVGSTVEYTSMGTTIHAKILKIKSDGKLILDTAHGCRNKIIKTNHPYFEKGGRYELIKNVCVMPNRVKKIK